MERQREYVRRMLELQLEGALAPEERCPDRTAAARSRARSALEDIREILGAMNNTVDELPARVRSAAPVRAATRGVRDSDRDAVMRALSMLEALPTPEEDSAEDCPICLDSLACAPCEDSAAGPSEGSDADVVALGCGRGAHRFHRCCIKGWAKLSVQCPLCREPIATATRSPRASRSLSVPRPRGETTEASARARSTEPEEFSDALSYTAAGLRFHAPGSARRSRSPRAATSSDAGVPPIQMAQVAGAPSAQTSSRQASVRSNSAMASAVSGYGRSLAAAAVASAQRSSSQRARTGAAAPRASPEVQAILSQSQSPSRAAVARPATPPRASRSRPPMPQTPPRQVDAGAAAAPRTPERPPALDAQGSPRRQLQRASTADPAPVSPGSLQAGIQAAMAAARKKAAARSGSEPALRSARLPRPLTGSRVGTPSGSVPKLQLRSAQGSVATSPAGSTREVSRCHSTRSSSASAAPASPANAVVATAAFGYGRALASAALSSATRVAGGRGQRSTSRGVLASAGQGMIFAQPSPAHQAGA